MGFEEQLALKELGRQDSTASEGIKAVMVEEAAGLAERGEDEGEEGQGFANATIHPEHEALQIEESHPSSLEAGETPAKRRGSNADAT